MPTRFREDFEILVKHHAERVACFIDKYQPVDKWPASHEFTAELYAMLDATRYIAQQPMINHMIEAMARASMPPILMPAEESNAN